MYQATDFNSTATLSDNVLDTLMNMAIQIGGKSADHPEQDRWRFCCLLLPQDSTLPVQKRALVVRSQSEHSPYKVNISSVYIDNPGLSLRAYQSGNIIYRPDMSTKDSIIAYQEQEQTNRSAIAIPIIGADGLSIAALYIASDQDHAFPIEDQRVLRIIGTMIEELLLTYQARQQVVGKRTDLIDYPGIVDPSFKPFLTENDFISDLEALLADIHAKNKSECTEKVEVSFIAIDIDHQSTLATKYGNRVARNLSREVGVRLRGLLNLFTNPKHQRLYHINTDRYYLILDEMSLDEARKKAEQLRVALTGDYLIDTQQSFSERSILPENMLTLPDITVRLGVPAYTLYKLKDILGRFDHETAVFEVRDVITRAIDEVLKQGRRDGGNAIISWDHDKWGYAKWTPPN
ncbi:MAG: GAF domain-containing protein [Ktedonobacteraceae bacterium]